MPYRAVLERIEKGLWSPVPGLPAQLRLAPEPRPWHKAYFEVEETSRKAGVLILLFEKESRLFTLLTLRTDSLLHHRGQISFPGGEQHPGESLEATALRETEEELGLDLGTVRVLGKLTPLYIAPSNYVVYPTVAFLPGVPVFTPQPTEVAEIIEAPVDHLADPQNLKEETRILAAGPTRIPYYDFLGHKIWGATAMILAEFLALVE